MLSWCQVNVQVWKCDYGSFSQIRSSSCGLNLEAQKYISISMSICKNCAGGEYIADIFARYRLTQCCHNPPYSSKWYTEQREAIKATGSPTSDGLGSYPTPNCEWSAFSTKVTCASKEVEVMTQETVKCSGNQCLLDGSWCTTECGNKIMRPRAYTPVWVDTICFASSTGLACPNISHAVTLRDMWVANVTNATVLGYINGEIYQDQYISNLVRELDRRVDHLLCVSSIGLLEPNPRRPVPGIFYDNDWFQAACSNKNSSVTFSAGYWRFGDYYVNPWNRELFTDFNVSWANRTLSDQGGYYLTDYSFIPIQNYMRDDSVLGASFGMTKVIDQIWDNIKIPSYRIVDPIVSTTKVNLENQVSSAETTSGLLIWIIAIIGVLGVGNTAWNLWQEFEIQKEKLKNKL